MAPEFRFVDIEAALPDISTVPADLQADRFDHARDLQKHETA